MTRRPETSTIETLVVSALKEMRRRRTVQEMLGAQQVLAAGTCTRPIEFIRCGDRVRAWSADKGVLVDSRVARVFRHAGRRILTVRLSDDLGRDQHVEATTEHPFWVAGKGWTPARQLQAGDRLKGIDGVRAPHVLEVHDSGAHADVYNFEVEGLHNYFVGRHGVLVHNMSSRRSRTAEVSAWWRSTVGLNVPKARLIVELGWRGITALDYQFVPTSEMRPDMGRGAPGKEISGPLSAVSNRRDNRPTSAGGAARPRERGPWYGPPVPWTGLWSPGWRGPEVSLLPHPDMNRGPRRAQAVDTAAIDRHWEAIDVAMDVRAAAARLEPEVTEAMGRVAKDGAGTLIGLENRLKTVHSLARKIDQAASQDGVPMSAVGARIKDALRYTMVLPAAGFGGRVDSVFGALTGLGFGVIAAKNTFKPGVNYKGINAHFRAPSGMAMEVQFHTAESYAANKEGHWAYEEQRVLDPNIETQLARYVDLGFMSMHYAAMVDDPVGLEPILSRWRR